ncbi:MAG: polymer-forming cytoskeletal protein [Bacteroidia bacterium]|nr:polymer-forming cytoskeletal protein [Bacteroidia bacterium]
MFSNNKNGKNNAVDSTSVNLLGNGTTLVGEVKSNGDFRIDGILKGNIEVKGKLVVGNSGSIEGEVICQNADISGEIKGKINVAELLTLKSTARLQGDIVTGKIAIEPEAQFTGTCSMGGGVVKSIHANTTSDKSNALKESRVIAN